MTDLQLTLSIITPTFNRRAYLEETLTAVLKEVGTRSAEVIVVDDASTDGTWEWLQGAIGPEHPIVRYCRCDTNSGPGAARNMGLRLARGSFFIPIDSDVILMQGGLAAVFDALEAHRGQQRVLLFSCLDHATHTRMDNLDGEREVTWEDLLFQRVQGELLPVVSTSFLTQHNLWFPERRASTEGVLWIRTLKRTSAWFTGIPIALYRKDSPGRLCSAEAQVARCDENALNADDQLGLFPPTLPPEGMRAKAERFLAAGTYYLLAGNKTLGRKRLMAAWRLGNRAALILLAISVLSKTILRKLFLLYRSSTRVATS